MAIKPLYYTFGNHMHWVDMQWLWGYSVLPGSVRDMLRLIDETGARGNVNFDGVGYEKMAAECPEALAELRAAVAAGKVEPVGCSYGQPYGLFQGGESNVRQLTFGARAVRRMLGVRPRSFWEEEFYFFPQLPQMLAQCGYGSACLFFQWTWHTPELPRERAALIHWEGVDGTRLPTLPRNDLNVHQWPEDFDGLLESTLAKELPAPAVVQWLELMPSKDWMCRSEVLLPRLKELMSDPRFDVRPRTVSQLVAELAASSQDAPVRCYSMDDVWHGMTLGKNGDAHPRAGADAERRIVAGESLAALAGLFGRPYSSWDVYPTWELDEAWRETLAAQHHDNHECEGLCGFIGHASFARAESLAAEVGGRAAWLLAQRSGAGGPDHLATNPLGWTRRIATFSRGWNKPPVVTEVPPFGYATIKPKGTPGRARVQRRGGRTGIVRNGIRCEIDQRTGLVHCGDATLDPASTMTFGRFAMRRGGKPARFGKPVVKVESAGEGPVLSATWRVSGGGIVALQAWFAPDADAIDVHVSWGDKTGREFKPDPGLNAALQMAVKSAWGSPRLLADTAYAVSEVAGSGVCRRKYPSGDWMTSPQWFESIENPFTSLSLVDVIHPGDDRGVLVTHTGSQQWFRDADGARVVLTAADPWDEDRYTDRGWLGADFRIVPHGPMTNAARVRAAMERAYNAPGAGVDTDSKPVGGGTAGDTGKPDVPAAFGGLEVCNAPNVLAHAFYRDNAASGEHLPDWAGHRMSTESAGACDHPFVIRLVEWDGAPAEVTLKLPGPVAMAAKTNLLGEVLPPARSGGGGTGGSPVDTGWLAIEHPVPPPAWARPAKLKTRKIAWSAVHFSMRPREIATIYADLTMGRKQWRDLDAKREVWATVHKAKPGKAVPG